MKKVIIDCDPGLDDALALMIATASEELEIIGVTTTGGNSTVENTTQNALNLLDLFNHQHVPVAKGIETPILGRFTSGAKVHGEDGIGGVMLEKSNRPIVEEKAHEFMYKLISEADEKVTLITTGPPTNVGLLLLLYPEIKEKIELISMMGGSTGVGNVKAVTEANFNNDPEAVHIIINSGVPVHIAGLNLTHQAQIYPHEFDEIEAIGGKIPSIAADFLRFHFKFYENLDGFEGDATHDSCAVAYVIDKELMESKKLNVVMDLSGQYSRGQTIVDIDGVTGREPNVNVGLKIDRDNFYKLIYNSAKYHAELDE